MKKQNLAIMAMLPLFLVGVVPTATAQNPNENQGQEKTFAQDMAQGNVAEIELGKLAQQKGSNAAIRDFGSRMVQDHTQLNNQLKDWARTNNVSLPTSVNTTQADQKRKLEGLSGQAFDQAYLSDMLSDHRHDIQQVQRLAEKAQDPHVKDLAKEVLPKLEDHLRLAENAAGQIGLSGAKGLNDENRSR